MELENTGDIMKVNAEVDFTKKEAVVAVVLLVLAIVWTHWGDLFVVVSGLY